MEEEMIKPHLRCKQNVYGLSGPVLPSPEEEGQLRYALREPIAYGSAKLLPPLAPAAHGRPPPRI